MVTVIALVAVEATGQRSADFGEESPGFAALSPAAQRVVDRSLGELGVVRKWTTSVGVRLHGTTTSEARQQLQSLLERFRRAAPALDLEAGSGKADINIYLLKRDEFSGYDSRARGEPALTRVWADGARLRRCRVLIDSSLPARKRGHLMRIELLRCLGLTVQVGSPEVIDEVLAYWYQPALEPGARGGRQ
jgi:hypothetical protein